MRIFNNLIEAHSEIQRDLYEVGVWIKGSTVQDKDVEGDESYDFMELSPYLWCFTEPSSTQQITNLIQHLELHQEWIIQELGERMISLHTIPASEGELNPGNAWRLRNEVWGEFIEKDGLFQGRFSYTYAQRFAHCRQLQRIKRELKVRPNTRQAVLGMHTYMLDSRNMGGLHRVPCSMFYHFMIRDEKLNLHYAMRSCDFHVHFPYDVVLAIMMQRQMASEIEREVGTFTHFVTSLHGFRKDFPEGIF